MIEEVGLILRFLKAGLDQKVASDFEMVADLKKAPRDIDKCQWLEKHPSSIKVSDFDLQKELS